jgi:hypothetical protein
MAGLHLFVFFPLTSSGRESDNLGREAVSDGEPEAIGQ